MMKGNGNFGTKLAVFLVGNLIMYGVTTAATNLMAGKDILGRQLEEPKKTRKSFWKPNHIVLGTEDYVVT